MHKNKMIEKLKPGEIKDVIGQENPNSFCDRKTNIPHVIRYSDDFAWGYNGSGPSDFALNILLHFTNGDVAFSRKHCVNFREEIVSRLRTKSITIPAQHVLSWIRLRKEIDPVKPEEEQEYKGSFGYGGYLKPLYEVVREASTIKLNENKVTREY